MPISSDAFEKRYFSGALKRYDFAFQLMAPLSNTTDDVNTQNMLVMRKWQTWIEQQEREKNYPDFGEKCGQYRLENNSNMPQLAEAYTDSQTAKYQFMATIHYYESKY